MTFEDFRVNIRDPEKDRKKTWPEEVYNSYKQVQNNNIRTMVKLDTRDKWCYFCWIDPKEPKHQARIYVAWARLGKPLMWSQVFCAKGDAVIKIETLCEDKKTKDPQYKIVDYRLDVLKMENDWVATVPLTQQGGNGVASIPTLKALTTRAQRNSRTLDMRESRRSQRLECQARNPRSERNEPEPETRSIVVPGGNGGPAMPIARTPPTKAKEALENRPSPEQKVLFKWDAHSAYDQARSKTQPTTSARRSPRNKDKPPKIESDLEGGLSEPSIPTEQFRKIAWDDLRESFSQAFPQETCMAISDNGERFKLACIGRHAGKTQVYSAEGNIGSEADICYERYSGDGESAKTEFEDASHDCLSTPGFYEGRLQIRQGRVEIHHEESKPLNQSKDRSSNASRSPPKSARSTSKSRGSCKSPTRARNQRDDNQQPTSIPGLNPPLGITSRTEKEGPTERPDIIRAVPETWAKVHLLWESSKATRAELVKNGGDIYCLVWRHKTDVYSTAAGRMKSIPRCWKRKYQSEGDAEHEYTRIYNEKKEDYETNWHIEFGQKSDFKVPFYARQEQKPNLTPSTSGGSRVGRVTESGAK